MHMSEKEQIYDIREMRVQVTFLFLVNELHLFFLIIVMDHYFIDISAWKESVNFAKKVHIIKYGSSTSNS